MARVGIVGVSGYGGSELLRLVAGHPSFELAYAAGETSAGQTLAQRFPWLAGRKQGALVIQPFAPEALPEIELLFVSLPTGKSRDPLARVAKAVKIVDVGGDHRFIEEWTYGLTELPGQREKISRALRIANPGCYAAAALLALAPLVKERLVELDGIVIDAKSGVTGAGRGGASAFGYAETNEDLFAYGLASHPHVAEIEQALSLIGGTSSSVAFTPHLVPMSRGLLATCYARPRGGATPKRISEAAAALYAGEPFMRLTSADQGTGPHTGWTTGSNVAFVSHGVNSRTGLVIALCAIDNLGKGAAGQALQNANLLTGQPETAGLTGLSVWP
jgi:N-acetyl-gamma-glutamyl-phosphate reductase